MSFTNEVSDNQPSFPNVYIHELESSEVGNSIPNQTIHALRDTIQIEVTTNTSKSDARTVIMACVNAMKCLRIMACVNAMKCLRYSLVVAPIYTKINNVHRFVIRCRRIVANGDTF